MIKVMLSPHPDRCTIHHDDDQQHIQYQGLKKPNLVSFRSFLSDAEICIRAKRRHLVSGTRKNQGQPCLFQISSGNCGASLWWTPTHRFSQCQLPENAVHTGISWTQGTYPHQEMLQSSQQKIHQPHPHHCRHSLQQFDKKPDCLDPCKQS